MDPAASDQKKAANQTKKNEKKRKSTNKLEKIISKKKSETTKAFNAKVKALARLGKMSEKRSKNIPTPHELAAVRKKLESGLSAIAMLLTPLKDVVLYKKELVEDKKVFRRLDELDNINGALEHANNLQETTSDLLERSANLADLLRSHASLKSEIKKLEKEATRKYNHIAQINKHNVLQNGFIYSDLDISDSPFLS